MNELIHIGNSDISIKEYNGQRVVTFKDIDLVHGKTVLLIHLHIMNYYLSIIIRQVLQ